MDSSASLSEHQKGLEQAFASARESQAKGNLEEAKRRYGLILASIPHHAESMTMLASIAYQQGNDVQAQAYIERAIEVYQAVLRSMPGLIRVRAPLINLLQAQDRIAEAETYMRELELRINPIRSTPREFTQRRRLGQEKRLPGMLMTTVPKSASESIWNKLAEGLVIGQGHLSLGLFPDCLLVLLRVKAACEGGMIAKEHLCATPFNLEILSQAGLNRVVCHLRDPRQATLSWAHFVRSDVSMRLMAPIYRKIVPPAAILKEGLPVLLDWCIAHYLPLLTEFTASWLQVENQSDSPMRVVFKTYEDFHADPEGYCREVIDFYGIDPKHFSAKAKAEVVHLRKGETEEWRAVFSAPQQKAAWQQIPSAHAERFGWSA